METIDNEKVIAEIKELYHDIDECISDLIAARGNRDGNGISNAHWRMETLMVNTQQAICNVIDTFEVKEVDLEKEIDNVWNPHFNLGWDDNSLVSINHKSFESIAKHFYELGLKAKI